MRTIPALHRADAVIGTLSIERFEGLVKPDQYRSLMSGVRQAHHELGDRTIWNVNSTASGGGIAEMLQSFIAYLRGAGLDARWLVVPGDPGFFRVTKRIHNHLHGSKGDGGELDEAARST